MREKFSMHNLTIASLFLTSLILIGILIAGFYPFYLTEYRYDTLPVISQTVGRGEVLIYELDLCKKKGQKVKVYRELVGKEVIITLPTIESAFPPSESCDPKKEEWEHLTIARDIIPEHTPAGEYKLQMRVEFDVTPIQTRVKVLTTEPFIVE